MPATKAAYRAGYDYQLAADYRYQLARIRPPVDIDTRFIALDTAGLLTIKAGYAWDGATGVPDVPDIVRGSLVHDALYQLMREGHLAHDQRDAADRTLQAICLEDGMSEALAELVYHGVRLLADSAADPATDRPVLYAPPEPDPQPLREGDAP